MRVQDFKKKMRRTTEAAFEKLFAECLTERGIYSRHMSDRFSGVPDRYIAGGRWVELKSLEYARGVVPYGAGMTAEQRRVCADLHNYDEVWYLALITTSKGQYVILDPMYQALCPNEFHNVHVEDGDCYECVWKYDGKETIRKIIPREWYI